MRIMMLFVPALLAACTTGAEPAPQLTEKQQTKLDKALAGKVAGEPVSCIPLSQRTDMNVISNDVLLYKVNNKLVYRNDLLGRCSGLTTGGTLVTKLFTSQMCKGDIAQVADLATGTTMGSCALGDFVPYRTPKG